MSCNPNGSVKIIKGSDHTLRVELKNPDGTAFDLSEADELKAAFPNQNGDWSVITNEDNDDLISVVEPEELGAILINLKPDLTTDLKVGERQGFEVSAEVDGKVYKVQFEEILDVVQSRT